MGLFNLDNSLKEINDLIGNELMKPSVRNIGDIPFTENDFEVLVPKLRLALKADFRQNSRHYSECLCMCLVYCAQTYFENNDYWSHVESRFISFSNEQRQQVRKQFNAVCRLYGLPEYEHERRIGHAIITPIICHAGIPRAQLDDFFQLFEEAVQDVEQSGWRDIADGLFDYLDMRAPVYVRRYIDSLADDRAEFFMQWQDVTQRLYHADSTADELVSDLKSIYENDERILIPYRFLSQYCEWRNRPIETVSTQKAKGVSFSSPRVILNMDGMGICLRLPPQRLQGEYPAPELDWIIRSDEYSKSVTCNVYFNRLEGQAYSEEASFVLKPAVQYIVELFSPDDYTKPLATWTLDLLKRKYLAFTPSGDLIRADSFSGSRAVLVVPEAYVLKSNCQVAELSRIPYWPYFQAYAVSFQPNDTIAINDRTTGQLIENIGISDIVKPELVRGELLFNNPGIYTALPTIRMPRQNGLSWKLSLMTQTGRMAIPMRDEWAYELPLQAVIPSDEYGLHEIRLQNGNGNRFQIRFHYVPTVSISADSGRWPQPFIGYQSNRFQCIMPSFMELSLDHFENETNIVHGLERRMLFSGQDAYTSINGRIKLDQRNQRSQPPSIPFRLAVRPLLWSVFGLSDDVQAQMTASTIRQDWHALRTDQERYVLISTGDLGTPVLDSRLTAQRPNGETVLDKPVRLKSWSQVKFSLTDLLISAGHSDARRLTLSLMLASPDQSIVGRFPLLILSERLNVTPLTVKRDDWSICFDWQEKGEKIDRTLICQNLAEPWLEDLVFPVMDGETTIRLPQNAFGSCLYACSIEPTPDRSPFCNLEYMPANLAGKKICTIGSPSRVKTALGEFNARMLMFLLSDNSTDGALSVPLLDRSDDVLRLAKTFIFVKQLAITLKASSNSHVRDKFGKALSKYRQMARSMNCSPETILCALLQACFSTKQLRELFYLFQLNWLTDEQIGKNWHPGTFIALAEANPELAFQVSMSTGSYLDWVSRWIGERDLAMLLETGLEQSPVELLRQCLIERQPAVGKWCSDDSYWGSINENSEFSKYIAALKPSESRLPASELLRNYDQKNNASKRRLFDKTYLLLLHGLKSALDTCPEEARKLGEYVSNLDRRQLRLLIDKYPALMKRLNNRADYDDNPLNDLAYAIGLTVFIGVLFRHGKWAQSQSGKPLLEQLARISRYFPEFYRHDLILIELYLLDGGT